MSSGSKAIIAICLCIAVIFMCVGVYLIFIPVDSVSTETTTATTASETTTVSSSSDTDDTETTTVSSDTDDTETTTASSDTDTDDTDTETTTTATSSTSTTDVSSWSTSDIVSYLSDAMTATKSSTGNATAVHSEAINITVTDAPGGTLVTSVINTIIENYAGSSTETVTFVNGSGTNGDGDTITFNEINPVNKTFSLPVAAVASATATQNGDSIDISVTLVSETVDMDSVPTYNSNTIGYLDVGSLDLGSLVTHDSAEIVYSGSTIDATINSDGLLTYVYFYLPLEATITGSVSFITGTVVMGGSLDESWTITW